MADWDGEFDDGDGCIVCGPHNDCECEDGPVSTDYDDDDDDCDDEPDSVDEHEDERLANIGTSQCDGTCQPQCEWCLGAHTESVTAERLKRAIRRFTVDVNGGNAPNGPVEKAFDDIAKLFNSRAYFTEAKRTRQKLLESFTALTAALAADTKELRESADEYFGEDFTNP